MQLTNSRSITTILLLVLVAGGCGSADSPTTTTAAPATTTTLAGASTTTAPAVPSSVDTLADVRGAIVQIVAEGTFSDPVEGTVANQVGRGSGFIIDPSGLAVTNNHVVTGAAILDVYLDGEEAPRHAKVVGVSECSDLAIIDIDGDGFPYLDWWEGDIAVGTDIYVAGFPLGDPEYTLTEGIISKEKADGETNWASIDAVLEHTARALPGNSGGPLVTPDGKVVGVHYSGNLDFATEYAISRDEVLRILDELKAGVDVDSMGINGTAFVSDDGTSSGIWVSSVASGSAMAQIGVAGGDIITELEGIVLATDGTMESYCDIVRSHDPSDALTVEVVRTSTSEVLDGTLNSGNELVVAFSFATELADDPSSSTTQGYEYTEVFDDSGTIFMKIPTAWSEVDAGAWYIDDEPVGVRITASPSINAFLAGWDTPGVAFGSSELLYEVYEPGGVLNDLSFSEDCTYDGRYDYSDDKFSGEYDVWTGCGSLDTTFVVIEARPATDRYLVIVQVLAASDADFDALDTIINSFNTVDS